MPLTKVAFLFDQKQQDDEGQDNLDFIQPTTEKATNSNTTTSDISADAPSVASFQEISLQTLLRTLPPTLSYTPLRLPNIPFDLLRRDMFDAQFQQIDTAEDDDDEKERWGPETDLVKGVYEGGMKTWECSIDLVNLLKDDLYKNGRSPTDGWKSIEGKRIMEVGCGTSLPSLYLLSELLRKPSSSLSPSNNQPPPRTTFHFLDYNELVLKLVTLPNVLLAFASLLSTSSDVLASASTSSTPGASTSSTEIRSTSPTPSSPEVSNAKPEDEEEDEEDEDNTFSLSATRIQAFEKILAERNIELRFFSGGWQTFDLSPSSSASDSEEETPMTRAEKEKMDIVLTSETVYQSTSLRPLVQLLRRVSFPCRSPSLPSSFITSSESSEDSKGSSRTQTWVAAKVLYFGLEDGGVPAFVQAVQAERGGWVKDIWKNNSGVLRWVGEVGWDQ
ncbi:Predicted methyltransferase [Phaffia rhodozyma]|uniref:protein-histidine N-methyltransferase n=1 Tax=Phaffia rhodozyma TaxID=264483 RepID=A0A0F7SX07_PHARH|nr:Predicted methyltransferase [Phaffia rhodozyma]